MRVIAQSTVVSKAPFTHIGYIATTTLDINGPMSLIGGLLLVLGGVLMIRSRRRIPLPGEHPKHSRGKLKRSGAWLVFGLGILAVGLAVATARTVYSHPEMMTWCNGEDVFWRIARLREAGKPLPENVESWLRDRSVPTSDGWMNPMRFDTITIEGERYCLVTSAGKDGTFGTDDDSRFTAVSTGCDDNVPEPARLKLTEWGGPRRK